MHLALKGESEFVRQRKEGWRGRPWAREDSPGVLVHWVTTRVPSHSDHLSPGLRGCLGWGW